jgi:hypothetical protein
MYKNYSIKDLIAVCQAYNSAAAHCRKAVYFPVALYNKALAI